MSTRKLLLGSALALAALSSSTAVLSAGDDGSSRGKPPAAVQSSEPIQPSQYLSGSGDVRRQDAGNRGSDEKPGAAASGNPDARTKSTESGRPTDNPGNRSVSPAGRARYGNVWPEPGAQERPATPGPVMRDRSAEMR